MLGTTTATKDEAVPSPRNPPVLQKVFRKRVIRRPRLPSEQRRHTRGTRLNLLYFMLKRVSFERNVLDRRRIKTPTHVVTVEAGN